MGLLNRMDIAKRIRNLSVKDRQKLLDHLAEIDSCLQALVVELDAESNLSIVTDTDPLFHPIRIIRGSLTNTPILMNATPIDLLVAGRSFVDDYKVVGATGSEVALGEVLPNAPRGIAHDATNWIGAGRAFMVLGIAFDRALERFREILLDETPRLDVEWLVANSPDDIENYAQLQSTLESIVAEIKRINDLAALAESIPNEDDMRKIMAEIEAAGVQVGNNVIKKRDALAAMGWLQKLKSIDHPVVQTINGLIQTGIGLIGLLLRGGA